MGHLCCTSPNDQSQGHQYIDNGQVYRRRAANMNSSFPEKTAKECRDEFMGSKRDK